MQASNGEISGPTHIIEADPISRNAPRQKQDFIYQKTVLSLTSSSSNCSGPSRGRFGVGARRCFPEVCREVEEPSSRPPKAFFQGEVRQRSGELTKKLVKAERGDD